MNITVIVCTCNRCGNLAQALESAAASALPKSVEWEILVVDNNSSDRTQAVVEEFSHNYPGRFRYLLEPHPGKSYALNSGVRHARGEIIAFMDDDVIVDPSWLQNLTAPLRDEQWAGVGGRTLMAHPFLPPRWFAFDWPYCMGGVLCALFDLGDEPRQLDQPPYGANMAVRKVMFEKYGNFRTDLGPSPNREIPRPNEDTEFGRRLITAGERFCYEPSALAYHPVLENRLRKQYFLDWWFDYGRALVREWGRGPNVWGVPRPYLNILKIGMLEMTSRGTQWITALNPKKRFFFKCRVWMTAGQMKEFYRLVRPD